MERKILVVDTSGPVCGVAVMAGDRVLCEFISLNKNTHSANLMPMIDGAFQMAGTELKDMDALVAVTGPGSFTGVRIGVATVKGLAHGAGKPCIAVDALEALSRSAGEQQGIVCPIQDARAGQIYGAAFRNGERLMPDSAMKVDDYIRQVCELAPGDPLIFVGDGAPVHRERLTELLGERAVFPSAFLSYLRPSAAGQIALEKGKAVCFTDLKETYLRAPNAEKNKKLLEAMGHE